MNLFKTTEAHPDEVQHKWYLVDAAGQRVGRVATHVANLLRGKRKAIYTPHVDCGDFVVVLNTDKMELTGSKWTDKKYYRHSRFFGSMKEKTAEQMKKQDSTFIMHEAVRGMLPTNKMARHLILKMKAYTGAEHPHASQKPEAYSIPVRKTKKS